MNGPNRSRGPAGDPAASHADDPTFQTSDERNRRLGVALLPKLSAVIRVSRNYEPENQVFRQQLEGLIGVVEPLLEDNAEAILVALDDDLYLNGVRIPVESQNLRFHKHVFDEFRRRRIAGLRLMRGITPGDLGKLFRLFRDPDVYHGAELLRACLAHGADHLQPVVHASTDAPDDDFEYDAAETPGGGRDGNSKPSTGPGAGDDRDAGRGSAAEEHDTGHGGGGTADMPFAVPRGAARKTYANAVQGARSLLTNTTLQGGTELRHAKRVVQPLVDAAFSDAPVVMGLHTLSHHDEYAYAHAVNVTVVAVTMGHMLGLERHELAEVGVAALLHDVGKQAVAAQVRHPSDRFDAEDWAAVRRHPLEGLKLIARSSALNAATLRCMRVAFEHHMTPDASGYPALSAPWHPSVLSRLVAVADAYVSLQSHRAERGAGVTPSMALGMMLGPLQRQFDSALLWLLVQAVGLYPPGQLVEMDDASIAVVLSPNPEDLSRPHLRVLMDAHGGWTAERTEELRPVPGDRSIRRALPPDEYPSEPAVAAA